MEYTIHKLSNMSGISTRTLRYYDEIDLLKPARVASSGYRIYGEAEVDTLQQILFYRELGFSLDEIKTLLSAPAFDREQAFVSHLQALHEKRARLDKLIVTVTKSMGAMKGEITMSNQEKFEGFKKSLIAENEANYGAEIRAKYGDDAIDASNAKLQGLSQAQYDEGERLRLALEETLKKAFDEGDPGSPLAQEACDLHRQWLSVYYPKYSKGYHMGLADLYAADARFRAHYDKLAPGCTDFLREAIHIYCKGVDN